MAPCQDPGSVLLNKKIQCSLIVSSSYVDQFYINFIKMKDFSLALMAPACNSSHSEGSGGSCFKASTGK
jgi:hypothetical protein